MRNDRMGPALAVTATGLVKASGFFVSVRAGLDQGHRSLPAFAPQIEMAIGKTDGPLLQLGLLFPECFACLEILARPALAIGIPVNIRSNPDHATMMICHQPILVDLFGLELPVGRGDLEQVAANPVTRGYVDVVFVNDRRWDNRNAPTPGSTPEHFTVLGATPTTLSWVSWMNCRFPPISAGTIEL